MRLIKGFKGRIKKLIGWNAEMEPAKAYNLWASGYDEQTDNPIVYLDEIIFNKMIEDVHIEGKTIVDIGCGTGKHWHKLLEKKPKELIGYEISTEMLNKLYQKYPDAKAYITHDNKLNELKDESCDIIVSTLVIGYIKNLAEAFAEWNRVLKKEGRAIITDFHPASLAGGAKRSFKIKNKILFIKNYFHPLSEITDTSTKMNWELIKLVEKRIDDTIRPFYVKNNSLDVYNKSIGIPILYACHYKKIK